MASDVRTKPCRGDPAAKNDTPIDPGSFRDPAGRILIADDRVFRTVSPTGWPNFETLMQSGVLDAMIESGRLWPAKLAGFDEVPPAVAALAGSTRARIVEHPVLPFVSYPYEWPYALAKRAALLHLDLHLDLLERGFSLIDGSAYNVQFAGTRPVFIDTLSIVPYAEGDPWLGYQQFCAQFLNPLLITAYLGIGYHAWFRGALEGISVQDTARVLPWRSCLSWAVLSHVMLHAKLLSRAGRTPAAEGRKKLRGPSRLGMTGLLRGLRSAVRRLQPKGLSDTTWSGYETNNSYADPEAEAKRRFVGAFIERARPAMLWDFGCNTGAYSELALASGAARAVGFDFDLGALEGAVARADARKLDLLPLHLDATNPSPRQGWRQMERAGLAERKNASGLLALAFLHHLVIGRNIPLPEAVAWLVGFAPIGVIEFVPKSDPMVRGMLAQRADIFADYDIDSFRSVLGACARIVRETEISPGGRTLFLYER
jgi:ribosomal protein L11 methylase PrmA